MDKVLTEAFEEALRVTAGQADTIIGASVIHQSIESAMLMLDVVDGASALLRISQMRLDEIATLLPALYHLKKVLYILGCAADDDDSRTLFEASTRDRLAYPCTAAGYYDHVIFEFQVHFISFRTDLFSED
jgi:hypothetical protein